MFAIYLKFQVILLNIKRVRGKKRKPKWLKRTIVVGYPLKKVYICLACARCSILAMECSFLSNFYETWYSDVKFHEEYNGEL